MLPAWIQVLHTSSLTQDLMERQLMF